MEITIREREGVRILDLVGRLTLGGGARAVYTTVREELDVGQRRVLLQMSQVMVLDSTGLGQLVACLTSARSRQATLKLTSLTPRVEDVLTITQTDRLFEIYEDEDRAIGSFRPPDQ